MRFKILNPHIIHYDFETAISLEIKKCDFIENDILHIKCFFHFCHAIKKKIRIIEN